MSFIKSWYRFLSKKHQNVFLDYKVDFKPRFGHGKGGAHEKLNEIIEKNEDIYIKNVENILKYSEDLLKIKVRESGSVDPINPQWNNEFLPGLDIAVLYSMIAELKPKKYVEVGSGNSTKVVNLAKKDHNLDVEIISIDPVPRAEIDQMADVVHRIPFENLDDFSIFDQLESGDVLFVDNSHRCLPNSDVTVFFLEVLPRLKKGVIVHIHDIYLPFDYPQFMCDRAYSEQYMLAMAVLSNPSMYKTIMPNYYVSETPRLAKLMNEFWSNTQLLNVEKHGGSYWIEIT